MHGRGATAGKALASSPRTGMISFTGSVETGSAIMAAAAANITKVNLELGGKAPAIVMGDADIGAGGQGDTSIARHQQRPGLQLRRAGVCAARGRRQFVEKFARRDGEHARRAIRWRTQTVEYGPLINESGFKKVDALVRGAVAAGASVVTGGKRGATAGRLLL